MLGHSPTWTTRLPITLTGNDSNGWRTAAADIPSPPHGSYMFSFNSKACWPNGKALDYESRDCRFEPCDVVEDCLFLVMGFGAAKSEAKICTQVSLVQVYKRRPVRWASMYIPVGNGKIQLQWGGVGNDDSGYFYLQFDCNPATLCQGGASACSCSNFPRLAVWQEGGAYSGSSRQARHIFYPGTKNLEHSCHMRIRMVVVTHDIATSHNRPISHKVQNCMATDTSTGISANLDRG
ncbi:uncharacterized protein BO97DRAFT_415771 [Aspergillus homomorphus CBS 101889]|uniref:Uncharacterized protein n=1 Tax=Aspergillus homomorphus (strain CBS 101889) TaxID=1450537 RepID=A0A395HSH4_ASPHC|nr:hypothetical protein BO97DRAFT_415771 [Aspergillus homomorphus CBS 101889]RAL10730.1 hypothetical protein BO97DRAFT_415771 [Aspergillus homomorphus CBS 101889]